MENSEYIRRFAIENRILYTTHNKVYSVLLDITVETAETINTEIGDIVLFETFDIRAGYNGDYCDDYTYFILRDQTAQWLYCYAHNVDIVYRIIFNPISVNMVGRYMVINGTLIEFNRTFLQSTVNCLPSNEKYAKRNKCGDLLRIITGK